MPKCMRNEKIRKWEIVVGENIYEVSAETVRFSAETPPGSLVDLGASGRRAS